MRNILQYPLTGQEILTTLENAQKDYLSKMTIGGMDGVVYAQLLSFLKNEANMQLVLEFKPQD